ncbi:MAG: MotA/TolQ/ExbB proton channel family protein [Phycisphaeraceae bacterium]|nr:MotA/TolQ/ExbB proton channel family protein [Phycisphaeraceae bacterium]
MMINTKTAVMTRSLLSCFLVCLMWAMPVSLPMAQTPSQGDRPFSLVELSAQEKLEKSMAELAKLNQDIMAQKVPLSKQLSALEDQLQAVRGEYQQTSRLLDSRTLDLSNLRMEIKTRQEEKSYLSSLFSEYIRNFESRIHIAESRRYHDVIEAAKLAPENSNLTEEQVFKAQADLVSASMDRLLDSLGGTRFDGSAVDNSGLVKPGTFVLMGPVALFRSADGESVGTVEQRLGSLEPTIVGFESDSMTSAAADLIETGSGQLPLDPTLGNAHKIEATKQTLMEHIQKGGAVMIPILSMAAAALLVALFKWVELARLRRPSKKGIATLLRAVADRNQKDSALAAQALGGPVGEMLAEGVAHIQEPVELIEEVMFEKILTAKLKLQRYLPFVAISASSAPLLGLLGTVTGIINTFKLLTVFGSGDVKALSGGISEALITTEFGLIVAIPSLLIHAFLSRKARGMIDMMEKTAISFVNQIHKTPFRKPQVNQGLGGLTEDQWQQLLRQLTTAKAEPTEIQSSPYAANSVGSVMDRRIVSVTKTATVADVIGTIRTSNLDEEPYSVCVVDQQGQYVGDVSTRQLLIRPEHTSIETLINTDAPYVLASEDQTHARALLNQHDVYALPVLDENHCVVGCVMRNGNGDSKGRGL